MSPAGAGTVRGLNLALVLAEVRTAEPLSRVRLAERTGLTRATVSSLVFELLANGLLEEQPAPRGSTGRPAAQLRLNRSGPVGLGVQVDVEGVRVCVVDLAGTVRGQGLQAMDVRVEAPRLVLAAAGRLAHEVLAAVDLPPAGVGLALPGMIDSAGRVQRAPNLPGWEGMVPASALAELLGPVLGPTQPVLVANEADLAATAELWFGGRADVEDFLHVSGEIGVGAGIVLGGRLFGGAGGRAGELGHVVVDPRGRPCSCGGVGCLEQVAGVRALLASSGCAGVDELAAAATSGDPRARSALRDAGAALGVALSAAVNLLDVPTIVLGGAYARLGEWMRPAVRDELATRCVVRPAPPVLCSKLGSDAAVRGAAATVVRTLLENPRR